MAVVAIPPERLVTPPEAAELFQAAHRRKVPPLDDAQAARLAEDLRWPLANALAIRSHGLPPEDADRQQASEDIGRAAHDLARALRTYAQSHGGDCGDMLPLFHLFGREVGPATIADSLDAIERVAAWSDRARHRWRGEAPAARGPAADLAMNAAVKGVRDAFARAGGRVTTSGGDDGTPCMRFVAATLQRIGLGEHSLPAIRRRLEDIREQEATISLTS